VLAASVFHFGDLTIDEAKQAMARAGIPVRPTWERAAEARP
jgi:cyclase